MCNSGNADTLTRSTLTQPISCAGNTTAGTGMLLVSNPQNSVFILPFGLRTKRDSAKNNGPETLRQQRPALDTTRKDRAMFKDPTITATLVRQLLDYDPTTGVFTWLRGDESLFREQKFARRWNARWPGNVAGVKTNDTGYIKICIAGSRIYAHRLAFLYMTGRLPEQQVDHINGVRDDNRWANLREVSLQENRKNMRMVKTNTTGVTGVTRWQGRWIAQIRANGTTIRIGAYDTLEQAAIARRAAEKVLGYHKNHGLKPEGAAA